MAQWNGQYSGKTHRTKALRIEETFVRSFASLESISDDERDKKIHSLVNILNKLLAARIKMTKAEIEELTEARPPEEYSKRALKATDELENLEEEGIMSIIHEFNIDPKALGL